MPDRDLFGWSVPAPKKKQSGWCVSWTGSDGIICYQNFELNDKKKAEELAIKHNTFVSPVYEEGKNGN